LKFLQGNQKLVGATKEDQKKMTETMEKVKGMVALLSIARCYKVQAGNLS